jgi:hypothetical protein
MRCEQEEARLMDCVRAPARRPGWGMMLPPRAACGAERNGEALLRNQSKSLHLISTFPSRSA